MKTHIITAISYMIMALIPAAVIYAAIILISTKLGKRKKVKKSKCIVEYLCLVYIWTILGITGIIGMQFNLQWFKESVGSIGFYLPSGRRGMDDATIKYWIICSIGCFDSICIQIISVKNNLRDNVFFNSNRSIANVFRKIF